MVLVLALTALAFVLARVLGAPRGVGRAILGAAAALVLLGPVLPEGHPLHTDFRTLGWTAAVAAVVAAYALGVRSLRRRAAARVPEAREHAVGLVRIGDDAALAAETRAALEAEEARALGAPRPLSLAWRDAGGGLQGHLRLRERGETAEIELVLVAEGSRGQGIASRLLEAACAEAAARGLRRMAVAPGSWEAPDFFRRAGFAAVAEHDLGGGLSRLRMERPLP